jgi:ubiquitin-conjugating enzyme E2 W
MSFATKRLGKELIKVNGSLPPGITLVTADGFQEWLLDIRVLDANPLYMNETYRLKFKFSPSYPIGISPSSNANIPCKLTDFFLQNLLRLPL